MTPSRATSYYWDDNGATPGTSTAPNGTLGTSAFLSTDSTGSSATSVTTPTSADTLQFVALATSTDTTSGSASFTVAVSGAQSLLGIVLKDPDATGLLTIGSAVNNGTLDIGASGIDVSARAISGGSNNQVGLLINSSVALTGNNTWLDNTVNSNGFVVAGDISTAGGTVSSNLTLSPSSNRQFTLSGSVNMIGSLNYVGGNSGSIATVSGSIGSNVTGVNVATGAMGNVLVFTSATATTGSSYATTTAVTDGTLRLNYTGTGNMTASLTGTGPVNVTGNTGVLAGSNGVSSGLLTVSSSGQIAPGASTGASYQSVGTLHVGTTGGVSLTSALLDFDLATTAAGTSDKIILGTGSTATGALTLGTVTFNFENSTSAAGTVLQTGVPYTLFATNGISGTSPSSITTNFLGGLAGLYSATYSVDGSNDLQVVFASVPEPSALALGACFLIVLSAIGWRSRAARLG